MIDAPEIIQTDSKDAQWSHIADLRPNPACTQLRKYTCKTCIYINDFNELNKFEPALLHVLHVRYISAVEDLLKYNTLL